MKRVKNIEFRWSDTNNSHELIRWLPGGNCIVIAFFDKEGEGYSIRAVGPRLLDAMKDHSETIRVWGYAETVLRAEFELTREE